jgi:hypothetical protein
MWTNIMPQLHFYVPDDVAKMIKRRAAQANQPVSRYVAELVKRDAGQGWPEGYFESLSRGAGGAALTHEPPGLPEERLPIE